MICTCSKILSIVAAREVVRRVAFALVLLSCTATSRGAILFTHGSPSGDDPLVNSHGPNSGAFSVVNAEVAEGLSLTSNGTPDTVQWFGARFGSPPGVETFLLRLYSSSGPSFPHFPDAVIYQESVNVVGTDAGSAGLFYSAPFTPGTLVAGRLYWLSIMDNDPSTSANGWRWGEFFSLDFGITIRGGETGMWGVLTGNEAVDLTILGSPSPEPSSLILLAVGGLALSGAVICRRLRILNCKNRELRADGT
jgi:hypothetical protein